VTLRRGDYAPPERTLVDILQASAEAYPDEPALDDGSVSLSYRELLGRVTSFARRLTDAGIGPGERVGIRISSGHNDLYVAILGTLQAGAAYVPVDADDPAERAELVFGEAAVAAVVTDDLRIESTRTVPDNHDGYYDFPYSARMESTGEIPAFPGPADHPVRPDHPVRRQPTPQVESAYSSTTVLRRRTTPGSSSPPAPPEYRRA
jgi:non-ribosomal peptide synthetase component F